MEYFDHLPEFQVIICKECKYAVLPGHINSHFASKPKHGLNKQERDRIAEEVAEIPRLIGNEETLRRSRFVFPPPTCNPIIALGKPMEDCVRCTFDIEGRPCSYICGSVQLMQEHAWIVHRWKSTQKGRPKKGRVQEVPWQMGVHCQRFFTQGPKSSYFEVAKPESRTGTRVRMHSHVDQFRKAKAEIEAAFRAAEVEENRKIREFEESREPNPWLRRVGWAQHLAGIERSEAREWVESPDDEEPQLQIMCKAFDWMIQEAQYTANQDVISQAALFEANRKELDKEPQMPFDSWMDITTIHSYTRVWRQLLCYIFRAEEEDVGERPPYKLTDSQKTKMSEVTKRIQEFQEWKAQQPQSDDDIESKEEIAYTAKIQRAVLRFCIELLDHPLQDTEYNNVIISGLAVLGIRDDDGWLSAEDYTTKYSAVIKLARLMVIQEGYHRRKAEIKKLEGRGLTQSEASEKAYSYYHYVHHMTSRFMVMAHHGRDPTPMQWIFKSRSYGFKIRYTTTAEGCIQWIGETVLYQKMRFDMSQFRSMIHGVLEEAREELFSNLMKVDVRDPAQVPSINWDHMYDNPSESRVGWSFLNDERSKFEVDGQWWLYERMYNEQKLRGYFANDQGQMQKDAAYEYQCSIDRFRELLLFLMHISSQPFRTPEILGLRCRNSSQGGIRNIFIEDGMVACVASYHKGYRNSGSIKIIHRYLPREVGELLVYYLWLVLPFHEKLQFQATGDHINSPFLWGDGEKIEHRRWTGPKQKEEELRTSRESSPGIETSSPPRQGPNTPPRQGPNTPPRQGPNTPPRQGQNTPPRQGKHKQPQRGWTPERMRHIIQAASEQYIGVKLHIGALRQIVIAISRRFCRENPFTNGKEEPDDSDDNEEDDEWDLQTGHGTHVGGMIYGRELMEDPFTVIGRREKFRKISEIWHRFLQFPSTSDSTIPKKRKRSDLEDDIQEAQRARLKRLRHVDISSQLKEIINPQAEFRSEQEPALKAIMENKNHVLVIMGTGGGKSLMFQIPARSQKSGITIVVVPLKSLEKSLHERCQEIGISCIRWDPRRSSRTAQIVLVQPESAVSTRFARFLNMAQGMGQLDRIVMEECHTKLDSSPDFRPAMRAAGALMLERGVQMVYLTATLPPADQAEFLEIINVQADEIEIYRGKTTRPNIRYSVFEHSADIEEQEAVRKLVSDKLEEYPAPAKIIVYCSSIEQIRVMGEVLGSHMYFQDVGSRGEKDEIQEQWESGDGRVVVASNAFGLGIDRPDVRAVIHVGPIYQMRSYVQESGRAGRDGKKSEAIIVRGEGLQENLQKQHARERMKPTVVQPIFNAQDRGRVERKKVDEFVSGAQCRRIHLDRDMDGTVDRTRCHEGEERCDVCEEADEEEVRISRMREEYRREEQMVEEDPVFDSGIHIPVSTPAPSSVRIHIPVSTPAPSSVRIPSSPAITTFPSSPPPRIRIYDSVGGDDRSSSPPIRSQTPCPDLPSIQSQVDRSISSSPMSSDQGFAAALIQVADEVEIQARQAERKQVQARIQAQKQQGSLRIVELEQQLERLRTQCPICLVRGLEQRQHSIDQCRQPQAQEIREFWMGMRNRMKNKRWFERFSCCTICHVPQAICHKWEYNESNGRWRGSDRDCQFDEIIMPLVATGIQEDAGWIVHNMKRWAEEGKWEYGNGDHGEKWFGQRVKWGDIEVSRLVQVFYEFVNDLGG